MPTTEKTHRAPAYGDLYAWRPPLNQRIAWRLSKALQAIWQATFGCQHKHTVLDWPDHERCVDCPAVRLRIQSPNLSKPFIGLWRIPEVQEPVKYTYLEPPSPVYNRETAAADRELMGWPRPKLSLGNTRPDTPRHEKPQAYCVDCFEPLDVFGSCPQLDPRDAVRMSAPAFCGKQPRYVMHVERKRTPAFLARTEQAVMSACDRHGIGNAAVQG
ncbi:MAG: hypothetical protein KGN79_12415 [Acidobacteriota bacterium]|nr:hypothetical protein [Acidobacteriota bacterium]